MLRVGWLWCWYNPRGLVPVRFATGGFARHLPGVTTRMPIEATTGHAMTPSLPAVRLIRLRTWTIRLAAGYLLAVALSAVGVWFGADDWWPPTLLIFGPRWVVALPLLLLIPLAGCTRSGRAGVILVVAAILFAGPVAGGRLSIQSLSTSDTTAAIRVMTWNTMGLDLAQSGFKEFVVSQRLDIVLLQEAGAGPPLTVLPPGWHVVTGPSGGVVASRFPLRFESGLGPLELGNPGGIGWFEAETPVGPLSVVCVHLPTPRPGIDAMIHKKLRGIPDLRLAIEDRDRASRTARAWVGDPSGGLLVAGDFNMPVESTIYQRDWGEFGNAFSDAGNGWGTTKQTSWFGVRIDHILYAPPWTCRRVMVGPAMGSDHRPVVAELVLTAE